MQALTPPDNADQSSEPELHLLPDADLKTDWTRYRGAAVGSAVFHVIVVVILSTVDLSPPPQSHPERAFVPHITPLYIPRDLTQKTPNEGPVKKELTVASIAPHPELRSPAPAPSGKQVQAARTAPAPPPAAAPPPVKTVVIEPPKIEAAVPSLAPAQLPKTAGLPPAAAPGGPPKLVLEDVAPPKAPTGKPTGLIAMPSTSLADAVRNATHAGSQQGRSISDEELGSGGGLNLPPSAGRPRTDVQLLFDPLGVDFRAYVIQVVAAVRRNWFAVYPEAARLGQRGQVIVKFVIGKHGKVGTLNFASMTGSRPLDQAAVSALSMSDPLPPLPPDFKGEQITLQMTFSYNMPR